MSVNHQDNLTSNTNDEIIFSPIKEDCGSYFVEYIPPRTGDYFASLALVFCEIFPTSMIVKYMEEECRKWLGKYSIPIMVTAYDDTDRVISLKGEQSCDYLTGILNNGDVTFHWKLLKINDFLHGNYTEKELKSIYENISFSTRQERYKQAESQVKYYRAVRIIYALIWLLIAISVPVIGIAAPVFGVAVALYAIFKSAIEFGKMMNWIKRNGGEKAKSEKNRKMQHYYYHCEKNPESFAKLRDENFKSETKNDIHNEANDLKK